MVFFLARFLTLKESNEKKSSILSSSYAFWKKLDGRVAIVTGASRGIGREIALTLARHGAKVVVSYQGNASKAAEVVSQIESLNGTRSAVAMAADVSKESDILALFDLTQQHFGKEIHIVVHSAGMLHLHLPTIQDTSIQEWDQISNVNSRGSFLVSREAARRIVRGKGGRIVNISTSGLVSLNPGYGTYVATKASMEALTKVLAKELKGTGITANCVAPGPVATDMYFAEERVCVEGDIDASPLERLGEPKDVAHFVLFVVSDEGEWLNGQVVRLNGGSRI